MSSLAEASAIFDPASMIGALFFAVVGGLITAAILSFLAALFPNIPEFLQFIGSWYDEDVTGEATQISLLKGISRAGAAEQDVDLSNAFPKPGDDEAVTFKVVKANLKISRRNRARLKGEISYVEGGDETTADFSGSGDFIRMDRANRVGFVPLNCLFKTGTGGNAQEWTTTCLLRRNDPNHPWSGFWIGFRRGDYQHAYFGELRLTTSG